MKKENFERINKARSAFCIDWSTTPVAIKVDNEAWLRVG